MYSHQLLEHGLGHRELNDAELDLNPPPHLLDELAKRAGLDQRRVSAMTMAAWVPWLFDSLAPEPDTYETYVHQFSLLLPPGRRIVYAPRNWVPWLSTSAITLGCRECLEAGPTILLFWQLPLMASCPAHRRRLETYEGHPADYIRWATPADDQRELPESLIVLDRRTWQAITTGSVDLPRRSVHAGVWFRLLRTLLDELSMPQGRYGRQLEDVRRVWDHCDHPFRAGLHSWQPFESLRWTRQQQLFEAAAAVMAMIEDGTLTALGASAHLLRPEPKTPTSDGTPPGSLTGTPGAQKQPTLDELWNQVTATRDACIAAAKTDPVVAKHLFDFARYGCSSEASVRGLRDTFAELQIPLDFLSQTEGDEPFA